MQVRSEGEDIPTQWEREECIICDGVLLYASDYIKFRFFSEVRPNCFL